MKLKFTVLWPVLYIALFAFLQTYCRYHFFYIEQGQLFQCTSEYLLERGCAPGGGALLLSESLVQCFRYPYAGAALTALLLLWTGIRMRGILRHIAPEREAELLYLLPPVLLLFLHFDFNYLISGTVAFNLMLETFHLCLGIPAGRWRMVAEIVATPLLYALAGPVAGLFALGAFLFEWLEKTPDFILSAIAVLLGIGCGITSVELAWMPDYRTALLPDAYYNNAPKAAIYYPWCAYLFSLLSAYFLKNTPMLSGRMKLFIRPVQGLVVIAMVGWGFRVYGDRQSAKVKELDYYTRTEQWDRIIGISQGPLNNYLEINYLNLALARKGELADRMFAFDQRGPQGVTLGWNKSESSSLLLCETAFAMGNTALTQKMAFEAYATARGEGNPRMLKRLVQTNLIFGEYKVAEKYLDILSNTLYYRTWAENHRKFLYDDSAIARDSLLGPMRKSLPKETAILTDLENMGNDLRKIAEANPERHEAVHYMGALFLLAKDMKGFKKLLETYYGTEVLPTLLPKAFQEAVITLSEKEPDYWKRYHIPPAVMQRFAEYKRQVLANRNNKSALPGLLRHAYGDTYWFYFMFK